MLRSLHFKVSRDVLPSLLRIATLHLSTDMHRVCAASFHFCILFLSGNLTGQCSILGIILAGKDHNSNMGLSCLSRGCSLLFGSFKGNQKETHQGSNLKNSHTHILHHRCHFGVLGCDLAGRRGQDREGTSAGALALPFGRKRFYGMGCEWDMGSKSGPGFALVFLEDDP